MLGSAFLVIEQSFFHAFSLFRDIPVSVHAWGGALAFLAALAALATGKGSLRHRLAGRYFVTGVALILISGVALWFRGLAGGTPGWLLAFLFLLAGSTLYATASGLRSALDRRAWIPLLDPALTLLASFTSTMAIIQLLLDRHRSTQFVDPAGEIALRPFVVIVLTALIAIVNAWFAYDDLCVKRQASLGRLQRLSRHLQRMLIAVVAVFTAFFIVELSARFFDRGYQLWPLYLGPGLLLSPLMLIFVRRLDNLSENAPPR